MSFVVISVNDPAPARSHPRIEVFCELIPFRVVLVSEVRTKAAIGLQDLVFNDSGVTIDDIDMLAGCCQFLVEYAAEFIIAGVTAQRVVGVHESLEDFAVGAILGHLGAITLFIVAGLPSNLTWSLDTLPVDHLAFFSSAFAFFSWPN